MLLRHQFHAGILRSSEPPLAVLGRAGLKLLFDILILIHHVLCYLRLGIAACGIQHLIYRFSALKSF